MKRRGIACSKIQQRGAQVLFKRDRPTDIQQVYKAAIWLGVGEFQIFCDAWQEWYHDKPAEHRIEPYFVNFLGQDEVPFWVRNYARNLVGEESNLTRQADEDSRVANNLLYLASIIAEYVLLACYLVIR